VSDETLFALVLEIGVLGESVLFILVSLELEVVVVLIFGKVLVRRVLSFFEIIFIQILENGVFGKMVQP